MCVVRDFFCDFARFSVGYRLPRKTRLRNDL